MTKFALHIRAHASIAGAVWAPARPQAIGDILEGRLETVRADVTLEETLLTGAAHNGQWVPSDHAGGLRV
jgi:hypothetical protein